MYVSREVRGFASRGWVAVVEEGRGAGEGEAVAG